jgi:hypothetical protein
MHLNEEQIQRLLHGELPGSDEPLVRGHLGVCSECRSKLEEAEREETWVSQRLRRLDHRQPQVSVENVLAHRAWLPRWGRWAASIILALAAAGVAYAVPGSPLPRLLSRIIHPTHREASTEPRRQVGLDPRSGIAVDPGDRLTIAFQIGRARDSAIVTLANRADVAVRARGGSISFSSDPDRLSIRNQGGSARFEIMVPRAARAVEIRSGTRRIWSKQGTRIVTKARRDSKGRYLLSLTTTPP